MPPFDPEQGTFDALVSEKKPSAAAVIAKTAVLVKFEHILRVLFSFSVAFCGGYWMRLQGTGLFISMHGIKRFSCSCHR